MAEHEFQRLATSPARATGLTTRHRLGLIIALLLIATGVHAQDPLSLGGPLGELVIQVTDLEGNPLPGVTVEASRAEGGQQISFVADATGEVALQVPVGRYRVRVSQAGFASLEKEIDVRAGAAATVRLSLSGGPIPVGGGSTGGAGSNPRPDRHVTERHFSDDLALLGWLGELNERLELVVPLGEGNSLFVTSTRARTDYIATTVMEAPSRAALQARLDANPNRRFCGIHVIDDSRYVMVFADE